MVAEAEQSLAAGEGVITGDLAVGASTTIAQYVLPRLLGAFLAEHPRVQFSVHSGNTAEIVELLVLDKVFIGLIEGPARHREVRVEPFMEDELVLISPLDSAKDQFSREQLLSSTLLMREHGSGSRRVVETALEKVGLKLKAFAKVMNLDSTEAIKSAVEAGLGVGFVSRWAIAKELELGALRTAQVSGLRITRHFSLVSRAGPEPHGASGAFREFALERASILTQSPSNGLRSARGRR